MPDETMTEGQTSITVTSNALAPAIGDIVFVRGIGLDKTKASPAIVTAAALKMVDITESFQEGGRVVTRTKKVLADPPTTVLSVTVFLSDADPRRVDLVPVFADDKASTAALPDNTVVRAFMKTVK